MDETRKMEIVWEITPAELRSIAHCLERPGCRQVRVNWYHTRLVFCLPPERQLKKPPPVILEIDGNVDGTITEPAKVADAAGGE